MLGVVEFKRVFVCEVTFAMTVKSLIVPGTVKNGVVVPDKWSNLPEGAAVDIVLRQPVPEIPSELQDEFAAWEKLGDEAWAMIDEWEKEDQP
jgi:hypothetical protein